MPLRTAGFSEEELLAAGLVQRSKTEPGRVYDRFRGADHFRPPMCVAAWSALVPERCVRNQRPKYLNTAENELYQKRRVLYGIDLAVRRGRCEAGRMILVEGHTDALALHQAGIDKRRGGSWGPR